MCVSFDVSDPAEPSTDIISTDKAIFEGNNCNVLVLSYVDISYGSLEIPL
jgi:hypothetical protein